MNGYKQVLIGDPANAAVTAVANHHGVSKKSVIELALWRYANEVLPRANRKAKFDEPALVRKLPNGSRSK